MVYVVQMFIYFLRLSDLLIIEKGEKRNSLEKNELNAFLSLNTGSLLPKLWRVSLSRMSLLVWLQM